MQNRNEQDLLSETIDELQARLQSSRMRVRYLEGRLDGAQNFVADLKAHGTIDETIANEIGYKLQYERRTKQ